MTESGSSRLDQLLADPQAGLDRVLAVIASVDATGGPTEDEVVAAIDELADACPRDGAALAVLDHVYGTLGFSGDAASYYDPANSLIHRVLERRRGIPLSLAAVASEVGRRCGVGLSLIGMPGHVLLGDGPKPDRFFDPFNRGAELGHDDCLSLFARFHPAEAFRPAMLSPMPAEAVAIRTLNNLRIAYLKQGRISGSIPVLELRAGMASAGLSDRLELADLLAAVGRYDRAADHYERLAEADPDPEHRTRHLARARSCRAHQN